MRFRPWNHGSCGSCDAEKQKPSISEREMNPCRRLHILDGIDCYIYINLYTVIYIAILSIYHNKHVCIYIALIHVFGSPDPPMIHRSISPQNHWALGRSCCPGAGQSPHLRGIRQIPWIYPLVMTFTVRHGKSPCY